ncbi:MAG: glucosamine-6-phosphate deaminase [Planctomycetota bacterium]|jgi:glucosamine-6-phosphate deaminase
MEVIIHKNPESASKTAARLLARLVKEKPDAVLGLATGSTPLMVYQELVRMHCDEGLDFSKVTTFNLDEYVGLPPDHSQSYRRFMEENLFHALNVPEGNIHIPDGMAEDIPSVCRAYEEEINNAGGLDLQLLGIGSDGHIAFNEPSSSLASRTRIKTITEQTRRDNARFFDSEEEVPRHVITMGVGTILEARVLVLMAFGRGKALAVADAVEGPVTAMVPASMLQLHPEVKIIVDEEAASLLSRAEYYRWVYEHKPEWQKF